MDEPRRSAIYSIQLGADGKPMTGGADDQRKKEPDVFPPPPPPKSSSKAAESAKKNKQSHKKKQSAAHKNHHKVAGGNRLKSCGGCPELAAPGHKLCHVCVNRKKSPAKQTCNHYCGVYKTCLILGPDPRLSVDDGKKVIQGLNALRCNSCWRKDIIDEELAKSRN